MRSLHALSLLLLCLSASGAAAAANPAAQAAVARTLADPTTAQFRHMSTHGDVVCGEVAAKGMGFTPFYAYAKDKEWTVHAAADHMGPMDGLRCFDKEIDTGKKVATCSGYDFQFYFAYDHFCR